MSRFQTAPPSPLPSKAQVLATSLGDFAVDLLLPTVLYALLAPTHLSAVVRLTIGGFFVAAKAGVGRFSERGPHFLQDILNAALLAVACSAVTMAAAFRGKTDMLAIGLGTGLLVIIQGLRLARTWRRLDGFALLVLIELAATILLTSISRDPRLVLLRPSFYTAIAGVYALTTVWTPRPLMMEASKPMAAGGDRVRAEAFERAGRESIPFRRAEQAMTAGLALVLLAEAVLRAVIIFSHPASRVFAASLWSQAASIGLFVIFFAVARFVFVPRARREVNALMPRHP